MEGWLSGRKHLTANEAVRNGTGVRISHLPQTPRDVQRAIPVSRQHHLLRSLRRYSSQGASLYVYRIETASKETDKLKEWKRRYQIRKYSRRRQGKFRICKTYEIGQRLADR